MLQELPEQLQPHMLIDVFALAICHQMILGQTFSRTHAGHGCEDDAERLHIAHVADGLLPVASHVHRRRFLRNPDSPHAAAVASADHTSRGAEGGGGASITDGGPGR